MTKQAVLLLQQAIACEGLELDDTVEDVDVEDNLTWTVWLFFAAQLLHGAGASPLFTLGVTYLDENVSTKMSSVYLGKFNCRIDKTFRRRSFSQPLPPYPVPFLTPSVW